MKAFLVLTVLVLCSGLAVAQPSQDMPHRVFGTVEDTQGNAVTDTTVEVVFDEETLASDTTNGDGYYDITVPYGEEYSGEEVQIQVDGTQGDTFTYTSGGVEEIDLVVDTSSQNNQEEMQGSSGGGGGALPTQDEEQQEETNSTTTNTTENTTEENLTEDGSETDSEDTDSTDSTNTSETDNQDDSQDTGNSLTGMFSSSTSAVGEMITGFFSSIVSGIMNIFG